MPSRRSVPAATRGDAGQRRVITWGRRQRAKSLPKANPPPRGVCIGVIWLLRGYPTASAFLRSSLACTFGSLVAHGLFFSRGTGMKKTGEKEKCPWGGYLIVPVGIPYCSRRDTFILSYGGYLTVHPTGDTFILSYGGYLIVCRRQYLTVHPTGDTLLFAVGNTFMGRRTSKLIKSHNMIEVGERYVRKHVYARL
jgi:hypothetical protein